MAAKATVATAEAQIKTAEAAVERPRLTSISPASLRPLTALRDRLSFK